jgi:hypothetical protein
MDAPGTPALATAVPVAIASRAATRAGRLLAPGEQGYSGERGGQALGERLQQVVAVGQVGALVREDRAELGRVEDLQGPAGEHDRGRPARHAVGGGARVVEDDRRRGPAPCRSDTRRSGTGRSAADGHAIRERAADQAGRLGVRPGLPP